MVGGGSSIGRGDLVRARETETECRNFAGPYLNRRKETEGLGLRHSIFVCATTRNHHVIPPACEAGNETVVREWIW